MATLIRITPVRRPARAAHRKTRRVMLGLLGLAIGAVGALTLQSQPHSQRQLALSAVAKIEPSRPNHLSIPAIDVDAPIGQIGTDRNGELEAPKDYNAVGWYVESAQVGQLGPAVLAGHLDSPTGPAVFADLKKLKKGDQITITGQNGKNSVYLVESGEQYAQSSFPTERVYGSLDYPGLRLITCAGTYQQQQARYSDNYIVYARLKVS